MIDFRAALRRLFNSSVVWSWALNSFRLASGLLLLPLLLKVLPVADLGMYYVFLSLTALLPIIDFGFSVSIGRYVSYAMAGATELKAQGLVLTEQANSPNYPLLWRLLFTTRQIFQFLSLMALLLLGLAGTWAVGLRVQETVSPHHTWMAWSLTLFSAVLEIYSGWWNVFLRGMNEVLLSSRIAVLAYGLRLVLACLLLLCGAGLLALPAAGLVSSICQRQLARRHCLRRLEASGVVAKDREVSLLSLLWPMSWRVGLQFLSSYLLTNGNALICLRVFGLAVTAQYGLSVQVAGITASMASVWLNVKWPLVGQYRTRQDTSGLRRLLWPRLWLQAATFLLLGCAAVVLGPLLLRWQGGHKELLPRLWFALLLLNTLLELQFSFWTTLLSMENRVPSLWPTVVTNVASFSLVLLLLHFSSLGPAAFVISPLLVYSLFSYWYWPRAGARSLRTSWLRFTFSRPPGRDANLPPDELISAEKPLLSAKGQP